MVYTVSSDHVCRDDVTKMLQDPSHTGFSWSHRVIDSIDHRNRASMQQQTERAHQQLALRAGTGEPGAFLPHAGAFSRAGPAAPAAHRLRF